MDLPTLPYDFDDGMLARTRDDNQPRVRVYPFEQVAVVIGRGGHQELELHGDRIAADGVPLYKRPGGGCSVVLDPGNLIVALALPLPGIGRIKTAFAAITDWMIEGLAASGVPGVVQRGVSDLVLDERKIGGSCVYRTRNLLYYSTTLLLDPDVSLMDRYLQHPPREPEYRQGRPHSLFVASLSRNSPIHVDGGLAMNLKFHLHNQLASLWRNCDK